LVGGLAVLGLLFIIAGPGSAGGEAELAGKVNKIADAFQKGDAAGAKAQASALAKATELEDVMHLFRPRKKKGIGVGDKAGAITPDGIEQQLIALGRDAPPAALLAKEGAALERMGHVTAAIGEFTIAKAPEKDMGKKKAKDWVTWATEMRDASLDFAKVARGGNPASVHKAAAKVNAACNNCHSVFRE